MTTEEIHDVIVVGGGPAGLSVSSQLSRHHRVLVLERSPEIGTTKSWFIPRQAIEDGRAEDIEPFTYGGVKRFLTDTLGTTARAWDARLAGGYPFLRDVELLEYWAGQVAGNGSRVLTNCCYFDHEVVHGTRGSYVEVATSRGRHRGRLLVDASGHDSMVRAKCRLEDRSSYWWSVYGGIAEHPSGLSGMKVGDYLLWGTYADTNPDPDATLDGGRPVFEYEILDERRSFPLVLFLRRGKVSRPVLQAAFEHILRTEEATAPFHDVRIVQPKWGWYPSGGPFRQAALDHVTFIGDAGCWSTPCGWGMAFIVRHYKSYARQLHRCLERGTLDQTSLHQAFFLSDQEQNQIRLNRIAVRFLSNAPARLLDQFVHVWEHAGGPEGDTDGLPFLLCEKLFTLSITPEETLQILGRLVPELKPRDALQMFPAQEVVPLLRGGFGLTEELLRPHLRAPLSPVGRIQRVEQRGPETA